VHGVLMYAYSFHLRPVCTFLLCSCIGVGVHLAVMSAESIRSCVAVTVKLSSSF